MARILVVDDEASIRDIIAVLLRDRGHDVSTASTAGEAIANCARTNPDLAVLDLLLPDANGVDLLQQLRKIREHLGCVFITAFGSIRSAVDAIRAGGDDYLTKPFDNDDLLITIDRVLERWRLTQEVQALRDELNTRYGFSDIIAVCPAMREVFRVMSRVANIDTTVLVLGESGTGKELVARGIHQRSGRSAAPFVAVNCSAVPASLIEAEFFGHERGAFTDAKDSHPGWFEQAHRGTLFLDEIGDLPLDAQAKLLRVLQDGQVTRLGGRRSTRVDVRVIAATNRNLEKEVQTGRFREDLFWRLNVLAIRLPALRERSEDLPLLIDALLQRINAELQLGVDSISDDARRLLLAHDWPGNVRELENALRGAMIVCEGRRLQVCDLPPRIRGELEGHGLSGSGGTNLADAVASAVQRVENVLIRAALATHAGNRSAAALSLGINRKTLFYKMREYKLTTESDRDE